MNDFWFHISSTVTYFKSIFPNFDSGGEKKNQKEEMKCPGWVQKWKEGYCVDIICLQSCCFTSGNKVAPQIMINSKANSALCFSSMFSVSDTLVIISSLSEPVKPVEAVQSTWSEAGLVNIFCVGWKQLVWMNFDL